MYNSAVALIVESNQTLNKCLHFRLYAHSYNPKPVRLFPVENRAFVQWDSNLVPNARQGQPNEPLGHTVP